MDEHFSFNFEEVKTYTLEPAESVDWLYMHSFTQSETRPMDEEDRLDLTTDAELEGGRVPIDDISLNFGDIDF